MLLVPSNVSAIGDGAHFGRDTAFVEMKEQQAQARITDRTPFIVGSPGNEIAHFGLTVMEGSRCR